ncbi:MAG TPA: M67 family metallopeptidase [Candidatus Dormibacteraeota bacterium]
MKITRAALVAIQEHGEEGYPYEICGVMLGPRGSRGRVTETRRAKNTVVDRAHDRYEIDPRDLIRIEREADAAGFEIVGYYHSHPDHPAQASATDAQRSWAGPVYLIVAVHQGKAVDQNAFVAERDGGPMRGEDLEVG